MHPVFFKLTLWSDPQEWDVRPIFRDAAWGSSRVRTHAAPRPDEPTAHCNTPSHRRCQEVHPRLVLSRRDPEVSPRLIHPQEDRALDLTDGARSPLADRQRARKYRAPCHRLRRSPESAHRGTRPKVSCHLTSSICTSSTLHNACGSSLSMEARSPSGRYDS